MEQENNLSPGLKALITPISSLLWGRFLEAKQKRRDTEDRLLKDLRQFKGIYDPDVLKRIPRGKSRTFRKLTRTKVKAMNSRLYDMLFPANKDRNWDIKPTPRPDMLMTPLAQAMLEQRVAAIQQQAQETGEAPQIDMKGMLQEVKTLAADEACKSMREEIDDQLKEGNHRKICKKVIHSGNLYGIGLLKAPLSTVSVRHSWGIDEATGQWTQFAEEKVTPYEEHVPVWDWYPDPDAAEIEDCEVFHERHVMNRTDFLDLTAREDFDAEVIMQYARDFPDGDCQPEHWETEVDSLSEDNDSKRTRTKNRFEIAEIWTSLASSELVQMGVEVEALDLNGENVWVCVWMVGGLVISVNVTPVPGRDHPYNAYYFDKDESSIWGEGIAAIMRDDQTAVNALTRASLDNVAATAGAITEVDTGALAVGESADVYPGRKFLTKGTSKNTHGAIRVHQINSRINEFNSLKDVFENHVNEDIIPSYMHGDNPQGVGKTVGGLSMLMGAANINVKDQVSHFDDGITRPTIEGFYHWNMVYNDREDIKGDFTIKATGSSSLVAKEIRAQKLAEAADLVLHPELKQFCDKRKFIEKIFEVNDLSGEEIVYDEEKANEIGMLHQQIEQLGSKLEKSKALMETFKKMAPAAYEQIQNKAKSEEEVQL